MEGKQLKLEMAPVSDAGTAGCAIIHYTTTQAQILQFLTTGAPLCPKVRVHRPLQVTPRTGFLMCGTSVIKIVSLNKTNCPREEIREEHVAHDLPRK